MLTLALAGLLASAAAPGFGAAFEDSMAQRVRACTTCHGEQGRAGPDGFYPRLAGKPAGYLYNQLLNIRDGRRHYPLMANLLEPLSDAYLMEMARHFSGLSVAYPTPTPASASAELLARGQTLATQGDADREIPPCQQCHGKALTGAAPHVPGLLGLPRDYLNAQLGGWRTGQRRAQSPDCMAHIASQLSTQDVAAVTHWLAAQPLPANTKPLAALPALSLGAKEIRCGIATVASSASAAKSAAGVASSPASDAARPGFSVQAKHGAYLARIGNCATCHTAPGGAPLAGQRAIETPFGTAFSSNLTSDKDSGLGHWSADDFWQAMHHGRSRDGRLLSPAFPYTSYSRISRADSDALLAYFQTVKPVLQPNLPHKMQWPFGTQAALAVWRTMFFSPQAFVPDASRPEPWNRGAYLVNGLGHCDSCHTPRNPFGATQSGKFLSGAMMPVQNWYAPSLLSAAAAGVDASNQAATLKLLKTGLSSHGSASGPMALVVQGGTQHLSHADLQAMLVYLQSLADPASSPIDQVASTAAGTAAGLSASAAASAVKLPQQAPAAASASPSRGAILYDKHCLDCHGNNGQGRANAYPALAKSRAVQLPDSSNLIQSVLHGGFAPSTDANPRPFGMPPFVLTLSDSDIAQVITYIRNAWGNRAAAVTEQQVNRLRDRQTH